ncbi:nuclease [Eikenella longinqua]|uniref:Nuclease n=2 Tax=Neisseriaceae TaxID=481 RepID=A0A1A9S2J7_9NEIS|nr:nuclease [Eikenella longinqua]
MSWFLSRRRKGYLKMGKASFCKANTIALLPVLLFALHAQAETVSGEVVRVWDGDSLHLLDHAGQRHKIRLADIDAPELEQPQGRSCRNRLAEQVLHRRVQAEIVDTDPHGRQVAYIRLNGADINRQQIADGCAWHYRRFARQRQSPSAYAAYAAAEEGAKQRRAGVWRQDAPQAPWQFRRQQRRPH